MSGQRWIDGQVFYWLSDHDKAVPDELFSRMVSLWTETEIAVRAAGYTGCIHAPAGVCPADTNVKCDPCAIAQVPLW